MSLDINARTAPVSMLYKRTWEAPFLATNNRKHFAFSSAYIVYVSTVTLLPFVINYFNKKACHHSLPFGAPASGSYTATPDFSWEYTFGWRMTSGLSKGRSDVGTLPTLSLCCFFSDLYSTDPSQHTLLGWLLCFTSRLDLRPGPLHAGSLQCVQQSPSIFLKVHRGTAHCLSSCVWIGSIQAQSRTPDRKSQAQDPSIVMSS